MSKLAWATKYRSGSLAFFIDTFSLAAMGFEIAQPLSAADLPRRLGRRVTSYTTRDAKEIAKLRAMVP